MNFVIFLNKEFLKPEEGRNPIFTDKSQSIKQISKILTEHRRRFFTSKRDENKYRGVVLKTLVKDSISNFINANCKVPMTNRLIKFPLKKEVNKMLHFW
jgi:hypothetical protein